MDAANLDKILHQNYAIRLESKEDMYRFILKTLNLLVADENRLTPKSTDVLVYRLMLPANLDCFVGLQRKFLKEKMGMSSAALSMMLKELVDRQWLSVQPKGRKMTYELHPRLSAIREQIEAKPSGLTSVQITLRGLIDEGRSN